MKKKWGDDKMKIDVIFDGEESMSPVDLEKKQAKLIMEIYRKFPDALWDKTGSGFKVLI